VGEGQDGQQTMSRSNGHTAGTKAGMGAPAAEELSSVAITAVTRLDLSPLLLLERSLFMLLVAEDDIFKG